MDRDRALPLALAAVAILALALSAATIDSAVLPEGASGLGGGDSGFGFEQRPSDDPRLGGGTDGNGTGGGIVLTNCWPAVREPPVLAGLGLVFLGLFGAAYRTTRSVFSSVVVCGGVGVPVGLIWAALAYCPPPPTPGGRNATGIGARNWTDQPGGGAGGLGRTGAETLTSPTGLLLLLVIVAVAVVAVAVIATRTDEEPDDEPEPESEPTADAAERIGQAAGAAADRIAADDAADLDNEVYRAWQRMTDAVDVASPETTTPRQFERAAVDAGMARDDVAALTDLFEAVRYGDRAATADAERTAVETLRRIEAGYGGE